MCFRALAVSPETELMRDCRASPEIELVLVCPGNPEIESTPVYRVNPDTVWIVAARGNPTSVDPDVLVTTYKIFQAELPTEPSGRIGAKRTWATFETIGKIIGAMLVIGTAI